MLGRHPTLGSPMRALPFLVLAAACTQQPGSTTGALSPPPAPTPTPIGPARRPQEVADLLKATI